MKGVAILLMMAAHLVYDEGLPKQIIYSFHMPLFFIVAGVFTKDITDIPSSREYTSKNAKRLLLPYVITFLMLCVWGGVLSIVKHDISFFLRHFFSMMTASADGWETQWGLIYAGPMWFLIAMFWVREIFYGVQRACMRINKYGDELVVGISIILSVVSVVAHSRLPVLPFSIMQACTALAFYAVGWYIHNHPMPWWVYGICVIAWPFAIMYGGVDIASCHVGRYPLSFIGACGGTYVIYQLCKGGSKVLSPLSWCGVYSLPILCMHTFEMHSDMFYSVMCRLPISCGRAWGGGIAILFAYIIIKLPILKDVYK